MRSLPIRVSALLAFAALLPAQQQTPFISPKGVLNAASFAPPGLPSGAIGRGSIFSIFGRNLGPGTPGQVSAFPLGANFQGVSIRVTQGSNAVDALPIYVSATQINAILPSNAPRGLVALQVTYNGTASNSVPVRIAPNAPGLFTATGFGAGPGIFQNYVSAAEQPINSAQAAAKPGQLVTLWGTGLGPISAPDNQAPPAGNLSTPVQVLLAGQPVSKVLYSGRTPCCSGVDQIVFEVPDTAPEGCFVPVQVMAGNAVSNTVTIAIRKDGASCADPANALSNALASGSKTGLVMLSRVTLATDINFATPQTFTADFGAALLQQPTGTPFAFDPLISLPPAGSCTAYTANGDLMGGASLTRGASRLLNAGSLSASGGRILNLGTSPLLGFSGNVSELPAGTPTSLFLDGGAVIVRASGGADAGAFSVSLNPTGPLTWTNRDSLSAIDRLAGVTFRFSGAAGRSVIVGGIAVDIPNNASAMFLCNVPPTADTFTVPAALLANLPASRSNPLRSPAALFVGALSAPQSFEATGLDAAAGVTANVTAKAVTFR